MRIPVKLAAMVAGLKPGGFRGDLGFLVDDCRSDGLTINWFSWFLGN
jgi:hypothetical protein